MLTRQKILLALLDHVGRPMTPTVFVKMVFLLRQETELRDGTAFYDFVPYKHGPFSFALYRELSTLRNHGYVVPQDQQVALNSETRELTRRTIADLPAAARRALTTVVAEHANTPQPLLVRAVYAKYPWYATRSEQREFLSECPSASPQAGIAVYTMGYEGKSVDSFFDSLLRAGIRAIVDVRANPLSRKYGFAKKPLRDISEKLRIGYAHLPELGIPSSERVALSSRTDYERLLDRYEREMLPRNRDALQRLIGLLRGTPSALVCMEQDVTCCHRSRLAKAVAVRTGLPIMHL